MDWSKDMGLSLVNLYKNKEVLWNPGNSEYHQKNRRHDAWQEVADELSLIIKKPVSSLECKRKMDTILSSFRRERVKVRKISEMAEGDSDRPSGSTWFLYDSLTFLIEKDVLRSNKSFVNVNRDEHSPPPIKVNKLQSENERIEKMSKAVETPSEDECYSYGMFVANKLKRYSARTRSAVQHAISDILFNADMGYYNQSSSVSTNTQTEPNVVQCIWLQQNESTQQEHDFKNEVISDLENESEIFN
ncbi:uncharacterized protein LOC117232586 [Bombus vosnesenskii]|uniref:Uncharacterized protein LOC117232039 n=3 Tax=Pyrobombus TaxID=144703 RepID=A0A6J3K1S6_9HYME|nr:uncharacterized protein LOC105680594 [Bombus impatiens]XP_033183327.1 uncharacterized protein LOC117153410 [Bombus vancouverensis nearcticus]XP_033306418.1 uncharacterized protein LOC117208970 [Bombus bifarius]XP_033347027.1 uncharacterized protein LOC117232039 [Bombus vosnesenskii]XP_033347924.1 uncharacterized protein LOC117232586 [Bombus vosnesenskii]